MRRPSIVLVLFAMASPALLGPSCGPVPAHAAADPPASREAEANSDEWPARGASKLALVRPPYPPAVERSLEAGRTECRDAGAADVTYLPGIVRTGDLTGSGRPSYVVDYRFGRCPEAGGLFSGTGGWDLEIFVQDRSGRVAQVFHGRAHDYDISDGPGPRTVTFDLHGSFCGRVGVDPCVKRRRIDGRRFRFGQ